MVTYETAMQTGGARTLTREQVPPGLRQIHDTTFESVADARAALEANAPSEEAIRGEAPWPKQPTSLLRTPRQVHAWSYLSLHRSQKMMGQPAPTPPAVTPCVSPLPSEIRDLPDLIGRGIAAMSAFCEKYPEDYAVLKRRQQQAIRYPATATNGNPR